MLGIIYALISSLFFSAYIIPRKLSKQSPLVFSLTMATAFALGSILIYFLLPMLHANEKLNSSLWWSAIAGAVWAAAFVAFVTAVDYLGLAKSNQWKNLQGPIGVIVSLAVLKEANSANPFFTIFAALLVFASALFFTMPSEEQKQLELKKGITLALISALGFGSVAVIQKYVTMSVGIYIQQVVWSVAIVISLALSVVYKGKTSSILTQSAADYKLSIFAGLAYLGASFFQLLSYKYIEASIGFTLIQMNAVWTILIGIFVFKEINLKLYGKRVALGFICALGGILLLAFAKR